MKILKRSTKKRRVRQRRHSCSGEGRSYDNLYARMETNEGEKELYRETEQGKMYIT